MPATRTETPAGIQIETDDWLIVWGNQQLDLNCKKGRKHTRLCGDPHIYTDGASPMDFPTPTFSFLLSDDTLVVADAPAPNQPLNDVHVFTTDAQHFALGASPTFDDVVGTVFLQQRDGSFYAIVSRDVGTANPNPVHKAYTDC
ncbi:MAG TPA: hypothetical protein VIT43_03020 [Candidatus Dormibacteraeota bacterium]